MCKSYYKESVIFWVSFNSLLFKKQKIIYFFIWLLWVLVATCEIFSYGIWTLSCGMWDLVPLAGMEPRLPALGK